MNFKEWLQFDESVSGLSTSDFTSLSLTDRMKEGRDKGEPFIKRQLAKHGIIITNVPPKLDIKQKVDGMWNGVPVQIKLRRSKVEGRNDISYEVCRNHDDSIPLVEQLKDIHQQGRDYKGQVKHYFVMNQAETEIYHIPALKIRQSVDNAISELNQKRNGRLERPFTASDGTELRPTRDQDPSSFTPFKVMAFIPVEKVVQKKYPIQEEPTHITNSAERQSPSQQSPKMSMPLPKGISPEYVTHADTAEKEGVATFSVQSTNPKRAQEKLTALQKYANIRKLQFLKNNDGTVSFIGNTNNETI